MAIPKCYWLPPKQRALSTSHRFSIYVYFSLPYQIFFIIIHRFCSFFNRVAQKYGVPVFQQQQRFLIMTSARSGSTLLVGLLNSHTSISCLGEILNPAVMYFGNVHGLSVNRRALHVSAIFSWCLPFLNPSLSRVGAKLFFEHLRSSDELCDLCQTLDVNEGNGSRTKLLVLYRRSLLDTYVSLQTAFLSDRWCIIDENNSATEDSLFFELDLSDFECWIDSEVRNWKEIMHRIRLAKREYIVMEYGELEHPETRHRTMGRVCRFLEIDPAVESLRSACEAPPVLRQRSTPLHEIITNYHDLNLEKEHMYFLSPKLFT
jgi:hypothetical protein